MLARTQLLQVQKELYLKLKDCAKHFFGGLSPEMRRYYREYQREFSNLSSLSSGLESLHTEMLAALEGAQIAICGDYHTLSQAQRTVIRLSRDILPTLRDQSRNLIIGLELATPDHDALLERFVAGKISEKKLLEGLDFERRWGFPWENYRPLFEFARAQKIRLVGLSPGRQFSRAKAPSLQARDRFAAQIIAELSQKSPDTLVIAMMGDLHLAASHLPRALRVQLEDRGLERDFLVIHQNNEQLYWELAQLGLDNQVDVVKIRDGVFCLFNTPPWVKLQSHLKWAELVSESVEAELHEDRKWSKALSEVDHVEEVKGLLDGILAFLRMKAEGIENRFSVHGPADHSRILSQLKASQFTRTEIQRLKEYLAAFQSVYIPRVNYLCLATPSSNHEARLAAIFLHASLSRFERVFTAGRVDFYPFVLVEALGFFGSKVINPHRKSRSYDDLHRFLTQKIQDADARKIARFCLQHWSQEKKYFAVKIRKFPDLFKRKKPLMTSPLLAYKASKVLGKALGEALYAAVVSGKIDRKQVSQLFHFDFSKLSPEATRALYLHWARRLDRLGYRLGKSSPYGKKSMD